MKNNNLKIIAIYMLLFLIFKNTKAQNVFPLPSGNVGIGTTTPSQLLEVSGGDVNVGKNSIAYGYRINDTMALWEPTANSLLVGKTGNPGTGLIFSTAVGYAAGYRLTSTSYNCTFLGAAAGFRDSLAANTTAVGAYAGQNNTIGDFNTFLGAYSGNKNTLGGNQCFLGYRAGFATTTGSFNVAVGATALTANKTGGSNVAVGNAALLTATTASYNTATGISALRLNTASNNSAFGYGALYNNGGGTPNDAFGYQSLYANTSGFNNVAFGYQSLNANATGNYNTALGTSAGSAVVSGSNNTLLGYNANTGGANAATLTDAAAIGSGAVVTTSNTMILGDNTVNVGIGYSGSALITNAKFNVLTTGSTITGPASSYGVYGLNSNTANGSFGIPTNYALNYGVYGQCSGSSNSYGYNYGGGFNANTGLRCVGVIGTSLAPASTGIISYGGYFSAGFSAAATSGTSYGVVAYAANGVGNYGIYASVPNATGNYAGFFSGNVYVDGVNSGTGYLTVSDKAFKKTIADIPNSLTILKSLKPQSYYYDTANTQGFYFPKQKQYGFIAQDLQNVLPELVTLVKRPAILDTNGSIIHKDTTHLAVNYNAFIAILTAAMQTQQTKIDSLSSKATKQDSIISKQDSINTALQNQINQIVANCCNNSTGSGTNNRTMQNNSNAGSVTDSTPANRLSVTSVQLSNSNIIVLNQNTPNPFAEQTVITYNIPQNTGAAQLVFYDVNGRQIQNVNITTKGAGSINVYANDLTNGIYSYTLIVDGKIIDTKRMIKQQ